MGPWLRLLRPGDWTKNVFVLVPAVFWLSGEGRSHDLAEEFAQRFPPLMWTFAAFCLAASGSYCVNDVLDASKDRTHPVKRSRPVASGQVGPGPAVVVGLLLQASAIAIVFAMPGKVVGACLLAYVLLQVAYNLRLKRVPLVDVSVLATGFCLRAAGGAAAMDVRLSIWLLLCVFFLTLFLGFTKRLCDLSAAENARAAGQSVDWRARPGYETRDQMNWLLGVSGSLVVMLYLSYTLSQHARSLHGVRALGMAVLTPLVMIAIHRFYRRANLGESDAPLETLRNDRTLLACMVLFAVGTGVALFGGPRVEGLLGRLLLQ
ncbi:MAG: UbiA prenyltransferase family protein [Planctomycetota bacterium]